jgi:predicted MFS family arabinose efflux permease
MAVCCLAWILAGSLGWRGLCLLYAAAAIGIGMLTWSGPRMVFENDSAGPFHVSKVSPTMVLMLLTLLIQAGSHGLMGGWLAMFLTRQFEITTLGSLGVLMAFWVALTFGRVFSGRLSELGSRTRSAAAVSGFVVLGCLFLLNSVQPSGGVVGAMLLGAGMGALHPLTLEYVSHAPGAPAERMFRVSFGATLVVGAASAALVAPLANTHGIEAVVWLALWLAVATPVALGAIALEQRLGAAATPAG